MSAFAIQLKSLFFVITDMLWHFAREGLYFFNVRKDNSFLFGNEL